MHEDRLQTYYEFLSRAKKHINAKKTTLDQEEAKEKPHIKPGKGEKVRQRIHLRKEERRVGKRLT